MKAALVIFLCLHGTYGYSDVIDPKDPKSRGVPMGDLMIQRITTASYDVHQLFWWEDRNALYYTDLKTDELMKWTYKTGEKSNKYLKDISGEYFAISIPFKNINGQGLIGSDGNFRIINFNSKEYNLTKPILKLKSKGHCIHAAHSDKNGVLHVVTKYKLQNPEDKQGSLLYKIKDKKLEKTLQFNSTVNDFVFSYDYKKMFVICDEGTILGYYDFDIDTGNISNPQILFNATQNSIHSEMRSVEIDNEGTFWISAGKSILVVDKNGVFFKVITTPFKITSLTFGGYENRNLLAGSTKECDYGNQQAGSILAITGLHSPGKPDELMVW